jgi:hypothetical protein
MISWELYSPMFKNDELQIECWADVEADTVGRPRGLRSTMFNGATIVLNTEFKATYYGYGYGAMQQRANVDFNNDMSIDVSFIFSTMTSQTIALDENNDVLFLQSDGYFYLCFDALQQIYDTALDILGKANVDDAGFSTRHSSKSKYHIKCNNWIQSPIVAQNRSEYAMYNPNRDEFCVSFSTSCDACDPDLPYSTIQCIKQVSTYYTNDQKPEFITNTTILNSDGISSQYAYIAARGVHDNVGFRWHPITGELWFTDNSVNYLGSFLPDGELNHVSFDGEHFGYPFCHSVGSGNDFLRDPGQANFYADPLNKFGDPNCTASKYTVAAQGLGPHVSPLGFDIYNGGMFPPRFNNSIIVAEYGPLFDALFPVGYRVALVRLGCDHSSAVEHEIVLEGFYDNVTAQGRPVDVAKLFDGSLLISDEYGSIFRLSYKESANATTLFNDSIAC